MFGQTSVKRFGRIRAEWGSVVCSSSGGVVVCVKGDEGVYYMRFGSLGEVGAAIERKELSVKRWIVSVPRELCILKSVSLPAADFAEAAAMVEFELPSLVPLSSDEIVYGCSLLGVEENLVNVLVCIVKSSTLEGYLAAYIGAGMAVSRVVPDWLAICEWFGGEAGGSVIGVVSNGEYCTVLTSVGGDFQKARRVTGDGGDKGVAVREVVGEILNQQGEICESLRESCRVLLAGSRHRLVEVKDLYASLADDGSEAAILSSPSVICRGDDEQADGGEDLSYEVIVAGGLLNIGIGSKLGYVNLLPCGYVHGHERGVLVWHYAVSGFLVVMSVLMFWLCFAGMNWRIERACGPIEVEIAPIEHIAESVEMKRERVQAVREQLSNRGQITELIGELYRYTPHGICISELRFSAGLSGVVVSIKGQAKTLSGAFDYAEAMRKAQLLGSLAVENAQQVPRAGGSVVEFKANCVIGKK